MRNVFVRQESTGCRRPRNIKQLPPSHSGLEHSDKSSRQEESEERLREKAGLKTEGMV